MEPSTRVIGAIALLASCALTCVNESRLVRTSLSFEQGRRSAVALSQPLVNDQNDGALVHFSGLLTTDGAVLDSAGNPLAHTRSPFVLDPLFGVAIKGVRLFRNVEMLQWEETSHTSTSSSPEDEDRRMDVEDRERVYMYDLRWKAERIDSTAFNDPSYWNPPAEAWVYESKVVKAPNVVVGDFVVSDELIDQIKRRDDVKLDTATRKTMRNVLNQRLGESWEEASALRNVSIEEDKYFYARQNKQISKHAEPVSVLGDLRVSFSATPVYPVTICARQYQRELVPYKTPAGETIYLLEDGIHSVSELFAAKSASKFRENRFSRLFSGVVGFIGFLVVHPLVVTFPLGRLVRTLPTPVVAASLSCSLTFAFSALCWLRASPLYSAGLVASGAVPVMLVIAKGYDENDNVTWKGIDCHFSIFNQSPARRARLQSFAAFEELQGKFDKQHWSIDREQSERTRDTLLRAYTAKATEAAMEIDSVAGQDVVINTQEIEQQVYDESVEIMGEYDPNTSVLRPSFPALSAQEASGGKNDFRRVRVPAHRYTPLKNDWPNIMKPIVEHLRLQIRMNTKTRCIELKNSEHTVDSGALQKGADFVQAYMMGFEVQDAVALLRLEDLFIDTFEVNDVKMLKGDHLSRAIGRVAGQDGKTKYAVENATRTRIVLADQKIHILGSFANIKLARDAICSLIMGAPPGKVYNKMRTVASRMNERF